MRIYLYLICAITGLTVQDIMALGMSSTASAFPERSTPRGRTYRQPGQELDRALKQHEQWLASGGSCGGKLELRGKVLDGLDFGGRDLRWADFTSSSLRGCRLERAALENAVFDGADMTDARFQNANMTGAHLVGCVLERADLVGVNLVGAKLDRANLADANLTGSDLSATSLSGANMVRACLIRAHFSPTSTDKATLKDADLSGADMRNAVLEAVDLEGADLTGAALYGTRLEPISTPKPQGIADARGLRSVIVGKRPSPLVKLARAMESNGHRSQSRNLLCAIRRAENNSRPWYIRWPTYILCDLTCEYGSNLGRLVGLFFAFVFVFALVYQLLVLFFPQHARLIRIQHQNPLEPWHGDRVSVEVPAGLPDGGIWHRLCHLIRILKWCMLFSCLSQVRYVGLEPVSARRWVLQWCYRDCDIIGTQPLKAISAIQSILGLFLVTVMVLSFIWNPFSL